jgi:hypothetical protein
MNNIKTNGNLPETHRTGTPDLVEIRAYVLQYGTHNQKALVKTVPVQVKIIKVRQERYNHKRAWFVNAWRIVDPITGEDKIQPWSGTKKEALETVVYMQWEVI